MKTFHLRLDDELHAQLKQIAKEDGISMKEIARKAIEEQVNKLKKNLNRERSNPNAFSLYRYPL